MLNISRKSVFAFFIAASLAFGCEDAGCGCAIAPLERDLPDSDKVYDGVLIEISPEGFGFLERNFDFILEAFLEGGLHFDMPPDPGDSCPDCSGQRICNQEEPCPISARLRNTELIRLEPNKLRFETDLYVHSGKDPMGPADMIPVRVCQSTGWCNNVSCDFRLHISGKPVAAELILEIDPVSKALTFELDDPEVKITNQDYSIEGNWICWTVENLFKTMITNMVNDMLKDEVIGEIRAVIDEMTCMPCDFFTAGCEAGTRTPGVYCDSSTGWCHRNDYECVRAPLGMVGNIDIGALLGDIGVPPMPLDINVGIGQRSGPWGDPFISYYDGPLHLRAITGAAAPMPHPCVPQDSTPPSTSPPPRIDFETESAGQEYHVGMGFSDRFINKTIYEIYRGGGLCLDIGSDLSDMISTGLFSALLPSLGVLTEGENSPMNIAVRPKKSPQVLIGKGSYREQGDAQVMEEPLLTLMLEDVNLDFYAFIEERFFRLFTFDVDIALPLGLDVTDNQVTPIIGELSSFLTRMEVRNSRILAEDPSLLEDIVPIVINLLEPMLADAMDPIPIPDLQGFVLEIEKIEGMVEHSEPGRYEHIGILGRLGIAR